MDDVFDNAKSFRSIELELADLEWRRNVRSIALSGEREGIYAGFEIQLQKAFDKGLCAGFDAVKKLAELRGRLMAVKGPICDRTVDLGPISEINEVERQIIAEVSRHPRQSGNNNDSNFMRSLDTRTLDLIEKVNRLLNTG
ncbi:unnamed protein product [Schistocephalus solidus]|uniref:Yae1_N domain-containing protein n=1 Tax=Schistocephalus solidus TaxID=70667 RepID=A0A0X3NUY9_SCHSO|nr:unnamed protein product [Schistocephalus solidus]